MSFSSYKTIDSLLPLQYGVSRLLTLLRRWQLELEQHQEKAFPGKGKPVDEELVRLQRENQRLKQEVEILKSTYSASAVE